MYARIISFQVAPDKMDALVQVWREELLPAAREQHGRQQGQLLVNWETGKAAVVGLWATRADGHATAAGSSYGQAQVARLGHLLHAPPVLEEFEVVE
jgi:heme-degrading monooxygenase HmoA